MISNVVLCASLQYLCYDLEAAAEADERAAMLESAQRAMHSNILLRHQHQFGRSVKIPMLTDASGRLVFCTIITPRSLV